MELNITGPEFLTITIILAIIEVSIYLVYKDWWLKRLSGTTKHGQKVYKLGIPRKVGYDLSIDQLSLAEDIYIDVATREIYGFSKEGLERYFSNNKIYYSVYPFRVPKKTFKSGFAGATYNDNILRLGILPFIHRTGFVHEITHDLLREATGDSDRSHKLTQFWEMGMTGVINTEIQKIIEEKEWNV